MVEKTKEQCRSELEALVRTYDRVLRHRSKDRVSEETVRSWINDFLGVFGWDVRNVSQVWQEAVLDERSRRRLADIDSTHKRPDYTLLNGTQIKTFLDAKSLLVDVFSDRAAAFQIRSYGWSAQVPCAVVSNFAQTAIYDTRSVPDVKQDASSGVVQIGVDEYLDKMTPRLLTLGLIEEEDETHLRVMYGDEYENVPKPAYKAHHGFRTAKPMVFSILVLIMRQSQRRYLATRKTFLYRTIFTDQELVDGYLNKGELHDQLQLMPMRRNETQPTQQS